MQLPSEAELLRIFIGESDKYHGRPLYEAIVEEARQSDPPRAGPDDPENHQETLS